LREVALEDRPGVDVRLASHRSAVLLRDPAVQRTQPLDHDVVIVVTACVSRDRAGRLLPAVVETDDDRRASTLEGKPRVAAFQEVPVRACGTECRDTDRIESQRPRLLLDRAFQGQRLRGHGSRVAQRAYRMTSSAGGTASSRPYAVCIRQRR
jgi:hypothetical protein